MMASNTPASLIIVRHDYRNVTWNGSKPRLKVEDTGIGQNDFGSNAMSKPKGTVTCTVVCPGIDRRQP